AAVGGGETGHCVAMSYPPLIRDRHHADPAHQFALHVVPLVVHGRSAERSNSQRMVDLLLYRLARRVGAVPGFLKRGVARLLSEFGDAVHRPFERLGLVPVGSAGSAIPDLGDALWVHGKLIGGCTLGAKRATTDRALGIAFDVDDLAAANADKLPATDRTIGTDARHFLRIRDLERTHLGLGGPQIGAHRQHSTEAKS